MTTTLTMTMIAAARRRRPPAEHRSLRRLLRPQLRTRVLAGVVSITLIALAAFDFAAVTALRQYLLGQTDASLQTVLALTRPRLTTLLSPAPPPHFHAVQEFPAAAGGRQTTSPEVSTQSAPSSEQLQANAAFWVAQQRSILGDYYVGFSAADGSTTALEVGPGAKITIGGSRLVSPHTAAVPGSPEAMAAAMFGTTRLHLVSTKVPGGTLIAGTSLDDVNHTVDQLELIVVLGSLAAVGMIGGGVLFLLRRGLRPIETMAAQADRISAGDLTDRVRPQDPRSEVGRLGAALNGMLTRIQTSVHEREAGQEVMRRFFADASHELRTPLASLRANAELYQQGAVSERGQIDEVMRRISLETRRMSAMVDDMLRLARLDQHPDRVRDEVDVSELVVSCVERAMIADPDRLWEVDVTLGMVAYGDEELLRRAVDNLIANVRAHTPDDTVATITASPDVDEDDADCIVIEVNDDGPGVPPDKLPRIFDRFYRAANPSSSRPGSGLGLAIVAEIAAAHHGTVEAAANDPQGLRVTLTLPVGTEPEPPRTAAGDCGSGGAAEPYPYRVIQTARLRPPLSLPAGPDAASAGTLVHEHQAPPSGRPAAAASGGSSRRPSATAGPSRH